MSELVGALIVGVALLGLTLLVKASALPIVSTACRWWVWLYTQGLAAEARDSRRNEVRSDLWDQQHEDLSDGYTPEAVALHMLLRLLIGVPADLTWRVGQIDRSAIVTPALVLPFFMFPTWVMVGSIYLMFPSARFDLYWLFHRLAFIVIYLGCLYMQKRSPRVLALPAVSVCLTIDVFFRLTLWEAAMRWPICLAVAMAFVPLLLMPILLIAEIRLLSLFTNRDMMQLYYRLFYSWKREVRMAAK